MWERKRLNSICIARLVGCKICLKRCIMANWKHRITSVNSSVFAENRNLSFHNPQQMYYVLLILHYILNMTDLRWLVVYDNVAFYFLKIGDVTKFPQFICFVVKICIAGSWRIMHMRPIRIISKNTQETISEQSDTLSAIFTGLLLLTRYEAFIQLLDPPHQLSFFLPCGKQKLIFLKPCILGCSVRNCECDYR